MTEILPSSLVVERGECDTSIIMLEKTPHVLGKLPHADTGFESAYVSKRHAEVLEEGGRYKVRDLGSENGTSVNGKKVVEQSQTLHQGDSIELAKGQVILRFNTSGGTLTLGLGTIPTKKGIVVDDKARKVYVDEQSVSPPLSRKEFDVLNLLYSRKDEACSKNEIAKAGWPERGGGVSDEEIQQCIRRVRLRVEPSPSSPQYIVTITGYGYRLNTA